MVSIRAFSQAELEKICAILADTGSEIGSLLARLNVDDPTPNITKRHRLFNALASLQSRAGTGKLIGAFIQEAMNPVRYTGKHALFDQRRDALNEILAFSACALGDDGTLRTRSQAARTLTDAEEAAGRLRSELSRRGVHVDVLKFCRPELLQENYFHATFEATKSVAEKIRDKAGVDGDGAELVDRAFGIGKHGMPLLAFNTLQSETERSEHHGLMQLMKGVFGTFRNTTAHVPKVKWPVSERDALDLLTMASYLHRRLDDCVRTPRIT